MTIVQPKLPRVTFHANKPGEPYRPCNGSEGEYFQSMWCEECDRDKVMNGTATMEEADQNPELYCSILNCSYRDDPLPEWTYGADGQPCCTEFVPKRERGAPELPERCPNTLDMFAAALLPEPLTAASGNPPEAPEPDVQEGRNGSQAPQTPATPA